MKLRLTLSLLASALALGLCGSVAARASHPNPAGGARVYSEYIGAPAQFDLSLAEISFGGPARLAGAAHARAARRSPVALAVQGPTGLDYVAGAVTRFDVHGRPRVLVLVVNRRPRGSLAPDVARIALRLSVVRGLGRPVRLQVLNAFARQSKGLRPALCHLPIRGPSLRAGDLRAVLGRGGRLGGFGPEASVAQAYDAVCGRPYSAAFRQAVTQGSTPGCELAPAGTAGCCPPNAMCAPPPAPGPVPPGPVPPGCPPCNPRPGYACPLIAQPAICPAAPPAGARRLAPGAPH